MNKKTQIILSLLAKTSLVGLATATLIATGGTDTGDKATEGAKEITALHASGQIDSLNGVANTAKTSLTFSKDGDNVTVKRAGKTYELKAADLKVVDGLKDYNKTVGDEDFNVQNISTEFLKNAKNYTTENVDLWWAKIENKGKDTTDKGYFAVGAKSDTIPNSGTATYKGGMTGYFISKTDGGETFLLGESELNVDFAAQNITGGIKKIEDANSQPWGTDVDITDGKLTSDGFSGKLKYSNGATSTNSFISGNFYGADAPELGGVGQIEDDKTALSFGFTAKK